MALHTAHTLNPVPIIFVSEENKKIKNGILADVAPSILSRLSISIPEEMTGKNLIFLNRIHLLNEKRKY